MTRSRSQRDIHAPPRFLGPILALLLVATGLIVAACGGSTSSFGAGEQPGDTMAPESTSSGY